MSVGEEGRPRLHSLPASAARGAGYRGPGEAKDEAIGDIKVMEIEEAEDMELGDVKDKELGDSKVKEDIKDVEGIKNIKDVEEMNKVIKVEDIESNQEVNNVEDVHEVEEGEGYKVIEKNLEEAPAENSESLQANEKQAPVNDVCVKNRQDINNEVEDLKEGVNNEVKTDKEYIHIESNSKQEAKHEKILENGSTASQRSDVEGGRVGGRCQGMAATSHRREFLEAVRVNNEVEHTTKDVAEEEEEEVGSLALGSPAEASVVGENEDRVEEGGEAEEGRGVGNGEVEEWVERGEGEEEAERVEGGASSVGSSLVGQSVTSWLATTSGSLEEGRATTPTTRVSFSPEVEEVETYSKEEYDRTNPLVDPAAASAEWELEKKVEELEQVEVELERGEEGLGLAIMGMGAGADPGQERLGIFVKAVTEGGVAARDGRVRVADQLLRVNGASLVGVSQAHAAGLLRAAAGRVRFLLGRERGEENETTVSPDSSAVEGEEEESMLVTTTEGETEAEEGQEEQERKVMTKPHPVGSKGEAPRTEGEDITKICEHFGRSRSQGPATHPGRDSEVAEHSHTQAAEDQVEEQEEEAEAVCEEERTGGELERSLMERYLGVVLELAEARRELAAARVKLRRREEGAMEVAELRSRLRRLYLRLGEEGEAAEELDSAVSAHTVLDTSAGRHRAALGRSRRHEASSVYWPEHHSTPNPSPAARAGLHPGLQESFLARAGERGK